MNDLSEPGGVSEAIGQARMLLERRRLDAARAVIGSGLQADPENVDLIYLSGLAEFFDDANDAALEAMETVLVLDPTHEGARGVIFQIRRESEQFAEAEQILLSLLQDFPEDPTYYAWYAWLMLATGFFEKARQLAEEAIRLGPEDENALIASAACALVLDPGRESRHRLRELVQRFPNSRRTLLMLVVALSEQGKSRDALPVAQELLRADPTDNDVLQAVIDLRAVTHWTMAPLWPMRRFGWIGSAGLWVVVVMIVIFVLPSLPDAVSVAFTISVLAYVVYSWVYPGILRRLLNRP